ncbi:MAG: VCBS repeat-containing protein, partial [Gemmataceae bacterium]
YRFFERSGLALKPPQLADVVGYYERRAPGDYRPPELRCCPRPPRVAFDPVVYPGPPGSARFSVSHVNLVHLTDARRLDVLACDMANGFVMLLRPYEPAPTWRVLARRGNPAHAEVVDLDGDGVKDVLVADLGSYPPTDRRCGSVVWLRGRKDGSFTPVTLLDKVGRVADVQAAPFRSKDRLDLVVAVFGHQEVGEVLLLENATTDWSRPRFEPRVLDGRHGAIHVPVADLDGDGRPDFVALISQEHEAVVAFLNRGEGKFEKKALYEAPHPGYGSSGIQLVDLDGDGDLDVLYTNGDILDEPYLLKPYHHVQWLENKGGLRFEHHLVTPMYGAHCAVAADLFGTGRKDIVAVSFLPGDKFPDRRKRNADAVVVLRQVAPGRYERHSLATIDCDHVTCAVGDVYGTGRPDLILGNLASQATDHPITVWKNLGP